MKKKDYDEIMKSALGGQLLHNINLYKNNCVEIAIKDLKAENEILRSKMSKINSQSVHSENYIKSEYRLD